jgi:hypothetical protein
LAESKEPSAQPEDLPTVSTCKSFALEIFLRGRGAVFLSIPSILFFFIFFFLFWRCSLCLSTAHVVKQTGIAQNLHIVANIGAERPVVCLPLPKIAVVFAVQQ